MRECGTEVIDAGCFRSGGVALLAALVLLVPAPALAGRLGQTSIAVNGQNWLGGGTLDDGYESRADVSYRLASEELRPVGGVEIRPDLSDPLRATLDGDISIDVRYGGSARVSELRLVRRGVDRGWMVDPEDVEKIAIEIGLGRKPVVVALPMVKAAPAPEARGRGWVVIGTYGAMAILLLVCLICLVRDARAPEADSEGAA